MTNEEMNQKADELLNELLADAGLDVEAELAQHDPAPRQLKRNGLSYVKDETRPDGSKVSVYALRVDGKTLLWAKVDLSCTVEAPQGVVYLGKSISWHPIYVVSADGKQSMDTTGRAVLAQHKDGQHIDGMSVLAYVAPRAPRYLAYFYGV
jgi:hypothetical protein